MVRMLTLKRRRWQAPFGTGDNQTESEALLDMPFNKVIVFGVLAIAVLAGGSVFAGSAEANVNESASLRLASAARPQLKAFARLQLLDDQRGGRSLRAAAQVESDGLTENRLYEL